MIYRTYSYVGGSDATVPFVVPPNNLIFRRLVSASVQMDGGGLSQPRAQIQLADGDGGMIWSCISDNQAPAGAVSTAFSFGVNAPDSAVVKPVSSLVGISGAYVISAFLPPDLWVPPNGILTVALTGATAPGTGEDTFGAIVLAFMEP